MLSTRGLNIVSLSHTIASYLILLLFGERSYQDIMVSEAKPASRPEVDMSSDSEMPSPKRRKVSSSLAPTQAAPTGPDPGSHDSGLRQEGSSTSTTTEQSSSTEAGPETMTPIDTWTIPSGTAERATLPMANATAASTTTTPQDPAMTSIAHPTARHLDLTAHRRMDNNTPARGFRPVYRRTGITTTDNDFTVHRVPAIPELNHRGNKDNVYEGVEATEATGFTTLRLGSERYRELFDRTDSMTRAVTGDEQQRNRSFVTLKYGKGRVFGKGSD